MLNIFVVGRHYFSECWRSLYFLRIAFSIIFQAPLRHRSTTF